MKINNEPTTDAPEPDQQISDEPFNAPAWVMWLMFGWLIVFIVMLFK